MTAKATSIRLAPVPVMRRGTYSAWRVLRHVQRLILQEPRRLQMNTWCTLFKGRTHSVERILRPACGTAACVGGWINIATRNSPDGVVRITGPMAMRKLGLVSRSGALRCGYDCYLLWYALDRLFLRTDWTSRAVIKELDEICRTHEQTLRGLRVTVK